MNVRPPDSTPSPAKVDHSIRKVLTVGEMRNWAGVSKVLPWNAIVTNVQFMDISPGFLLAAAPDLIVTNLVSQSFDFLDLAQELDVAGYQGQYRILSPELPKPEMVLSEARSLFPALNIGFLYGMTGLDEKLN